MVLRLAKFYLLGIFSFLLSVNSCTHLNSNSSHRKIATTAEIPHERVFLFSVPIKKTQQDLTIFNIQKNPNELITHEYFSLNKYQWAPKNMGEVNPKFLFRRQNGKLTHVHSFELGNWNNKRGFGGVARARESHTVRSTPRNPAVYAGLPPTLLNIESPRLGVVNLLAERILDDGLTMTYAAPIGVMFRQIHVWTEGRKKHEAAYLETMLDSALQNPQHPLFDHLTEEEARDTLASLNVRYQATGSFGGLFIAEDKRRVYSEKIRAIRKDKSAEQYATLVRAANEQGLWVIPLSPNFALLAHDPSSELPIEHWKDFILDVENPCAAFQRLDTTRPRQ
jgi:hypothetical protein